MAPKIPDRWKDYKPVGRKVEGTRFIAFKVPLREHISNSVGSDIRLDGTILLKSIPNLGLIIDLTNTTRYYDPVFFTKMGIQYKKLMIPGHETPRKDLVKEFVQIVKRFLKRNMDNDKLIGVHCTHGVNRTGYLICNYMISEMDFEPNEAIHRFANARGHKIERGNYINALLKGNTLEPNMELNPKTSVEQTKENFRNVRRDRYSSSRASINSYNRGTSDCQRNQNRRNDQFHSHIKSENARRSYQYFPEPRRSALRTDYYSTGRETRREFRASLRQSWYRRSADKL